MSTGGGRGGGAVDVKPAHSSTPVVRFANMLSARNEVLDAPLNFHGIAIGWHYFGVPASMMEVWVLAAGEHDPDAMLEMALFDQQFYKLFDLRSE